MSLAENDGREDLHPLEEGAAYFRFRDGWAELGLAAPLTVEQIAARVGGGKAHVLGRLRLAVDLGPKVREAFAAGRFAGAGRGLAPAMAFLAAGSKERQDLALEEVLRARGENEKVDAELVRRIVRTRFLLRLADARFPLGDEKLVAGVPACGKCPKNSSNQPELFEGAKIGGDALCTDPACFKGKKEAHATLALESAVADGLEEVKPQGREAGVGDGGPRAERVDPRGHAAGARPVGPDARRPARARQGGARLRGRRPGLVPLPGAPRRRGGRAPARGARGDRRQGGGERATEEPAEGAQRGGAGQGRGRDDGARAGRGARARQAPGRAARPARHRRPPWRSRRSRRRWSRWSAGADSTTRAPRAACAGGRGRW